MEENLILEGLLSMVTELKEKQCIEYAVIANGVSLVNFMSAVIPLTIFFQSTNQP